MAGDAPFTSAGTTSSSDDDRSPSSESSVTARSSSPEATLAASSFRSSARRSAACAGELSSATRPSSSARESAPVYARFAPMSAIDESSARAQSSAASVVALGPPAPKSASNPPPKSAPSGAATVLPMSRARVRVSVGAGKIIRSNTDPDTADRSAESVSLTIDAAPTPGAIAGSALVVTSPKGRTRSAPRTPRSETRRPVKRSCAASTKSSITTLNVPKNAAISSRP